MKAERKNVILEIGIGEDPFPIRGYRRIPRNTVYLGVEFDKQTARIAGRNIAEASNMLEGNVLVVCADAKNLPLARDTVSQVVFSNTLGATELTTQVPQFLTEAARVLTEKGTVSIVETSTPAHFQSVRREVAKAGFRLVKRKNDAFSLNVYDREATHGYVAEFERGRESLVYTLFNAVVESLYKSKKKR